MKAKSTYYRIGLFVTFSFLLLVGGLMLLGAGSFFRKTIWMETYFDESVQGLDVGSAVKHRGVQIGTVETIDFVRNQYPNLNEDQALNYGRYVYVRIALTNPPGIKGSDDTGLRKMIESGLRIRLTSQGLTGTAYLELDYIPSDLNPVLPINWQPRTAYVPSAQSTITRISSTVDAFFRKLEEHKVDNIMNNLDRFLEASSKAVEDARVKEVRGDVQLLIAEVRDTNQKFSAILAKPETQKIPEQMVDSLNRLNKTISRLDSTVSRSQGDLDETMDNLKAASRDMRELTTTAKRYPSLILFGESPQKSAVDR